MLTSFQRWQDARQVGVDAAGRRWASPASDGSATAAVVEDGTRACYLSHIRSQHEEYFVRMAGRVVELRRTTGPRERAPRRGKVLGFSAKSRARMVKTFEAVDWNELGALVFVGLTYPADFPTDGETVKDHLDRFKRRWRREFGGVAGAWKLEFQERGAPHLHLLLKLPDETDLPRLRRWVAKDWAEVVGAQDQAKHERVGTSCGMWRSERSPGRYFAKYGLKGDKANQNTLPPGFVNPGRFWGLWGIRPKWQEVKISRRAWLRANRTLRGLQVKRGRLHKAAKSGLQGRWVASGNRVGDLAATMLRQIESAITDELNESASPAAAVGLP